MNLCSKVLVDRGKKTKLKSNLKYFALISNVTITVFKQTKKKTRASIHGIPSWEVDRGRNIDLNRTVCVRGCVC